MTTNMQYISRPHSRSYLTESRWLKTSTEGSFLRDSNGAVANSGLYFSLRKHLHQTALAQSVAITPSDGAICHWALYPFPNSTVRASLS